MIQKTIAQYKNKSFLIAYSGGLDSTVLLHQFLKIKKNTPGIKIRAIHINHNINKLAKKWTIHCENTCKIHNVPLIIEEINIKNTNNIEEKLRIMRYNIIYRHLLSDEILLTGHHMNDQCETLILSLKRGSGPTGLSGMSFETLFGKNKKIVRPLLKKTKKELEFWAKYNNIHWIEDFSNSSIDYDRNFIRHKVMPILEKRWPFFVKNCFRTAKICHEETLLKNSFLKEKIYSLIQYDNSLNIKNFKNIKKEICIALIRYWISLKNIKTPSYKNIQCIYNQMIFSRIDANPKIILQKNEIRRYKKSLYLIKKQPILKNTILFWHNKNIKLNLPENLGNLMQNDQGITLPAPKNNELINIRFQFEGDILILGRYKKRKIKKIWQENNIPPWFRNQIPLLFYNNKFISALGVFIIDIKNGNKNTWKVSWQSDLKSTNKNTFTFY